jgi:hypothetical protein
MKAHLLRRSRQLSDDLYRLTDGREAPSALRQRLAGGSYDAVHEHHRSVGVLMADDLYGSAFVLLRPMFDGCVSGMWLAHLATEDELDRFSRNQLTPEAPKVLKRLEKQGVHSTQTLRTVYDSAWKGMSGYVHGGYLQVVRRNGVGYIGPNYSDDEICEALTLSNWFALLAAVEISQLTREESFLSEVLDVARSYLGEA